MKYADPLAQERIDELEAEVDGLRAKVARVTERYERRLLRMKLCYLDADAKVDRAAALPDLWLSSSRCVAPMPEWSSWETRRQDADVYANDLRTALSTPPSEPSSLPTAPGTPNDATGGAA
jgi:hypothetical protein